MRKCGRMKNKSKLLTFLCVPFLLLGCSNEGDNNSGDNGQNGSEIGDNNNGSGTGEQGGNQQGGGQQGGGEQGGGQQGGGQEQTPHTHTWSTSWSTSATQHWHKCTDKTCKEKTDVGDHRFSDWIIDSYAKDVVTQGGWGQQQTTKQNGSKHRTCSICNYRETADVEDYDPSIFDPTKVGEPTGPYTSKYDRDYHIFENGAPEIRFTLTNDPIKGTTGTEFATQPSKSRNISGWEVNGKFSTTNCDTKYKLTNVDGTMKVRGNYTTDYAKKGFRIKFAGDNSKRNLFGLNRGQKFKKWVLFGEVKDNAMLRNSLAFYLAKRMCGENIFVSDFTPAHVYINDQYWGLYLLAEQKEANPGRIFNNKDSIPTEGNGYADIAYAFELDRYATEEEGKEDGDPIFRVNYNPQIQYSPHPGENRYQCNGFINTYTMLTDLTDGRETEQLNFISKRVEDTYKVLYYAGQNQLKEIVNGEVVNSSETDVETCLAKSIDIDSFVDFYILNELACDPDIGYSSFYLAFDNTSTGDKRLRMDCPWDFDSAFGVRVNTVEDSKGIYAAKSSNMWFSMIAKLPFFQNKVKAKWNQLRENNLFEKALNMLEDYSINYVNEYKKNFDKWTGTMGSNSETNHETRSIVQRLKSERQAEQLLYHWFGDRVDYLETQFGTGRNSILSGAAIDMGNQGGNQQGGGEQGGGNQQQTPVDYTEFKANADKVRIEAETGTLSGNCKYKDRKVDSYDDPVSEAKYVGDLNPNGGSVTFTYNAAKAGEALLTVGLSQRPQRYKLTDLFDITVNGNAFTSDVEVPAGTGTDFHMWTVIDAGKINLQANTNTIVFTAKQNSTNFDFIDLYIAK